MFYFEELPNELLLIIYSYLTKFELIETFYQLNQRLNNLILKYTSHIYLSSLFKTNQLKKYFNIINSINSLTIDNYSIGKDFFEKLEFVYLENLYKIKLIDNGIDLHDDLLEKCPVEILHLVITSLNNDNKHYKFLSKSLKQLEIEFLSGDYAANYLFNQLTSVSTSILVDIRIIFSKLSEYFQLFNSNHFSIHIKKIYVSIFSIDRRDYSQSNINFPYLKDFQLEICQIPFGLIGYLLPSNANHSLERFAFIGQTTTINAKSWKLLIINKYKSIERFDLHLSNVKDCQLIDLQQWNIEFPFYSIDYNSSKEYFRIKRSKFDYFERILLNESIENLTHIEYLNKISHLIIRSEYWCSFINFSINIQNDIFRNFQHIKRLSTNYRQLEMFLQTNFLNQIEQLDLEFSEKYCFIDHSVASLLINLKSISLSSIYDGIYDINLHSIIKEILLEKFTKINSISIDAIRIMDEQYVEHSISQWYLEKSNQPIVNYVPGKYLSIWF